ncbi:MAG: rane-bound dehydrogenase domain protein [Verrucomicrobiales bacterium]|nr:rane-bound dehydrogenase domain protein [Verrucomicrobiales bacterium]
MDLPRLTVVWVSPSVMRPISVPSLLVSCLLISVIPSVAEELEGVRAAAAGPCPTVEEAISKMTVPDGYAVRCFASEPMIVNPVAMTWDARGRLWVVELYEYPSGAAKPNAYATTATDEQFRPVIPQGPDSPRDRVVVLEDTDNDGKADKRTVFAEGLSLATAVLCGNGGVYIGQAPNLFFFRDKDGDDRADEYKTVLTGFGLEDRHELLNSFTWGPDGWMYFTHGVFTHSKVRRPEQKPEEGFTLNAGIFRVKLSEKKDGPRAEQYEVYADGTSNPWGVDFDARGNAFVEACVIDHFFHMAPGGIYARQGGAPENPYAYELLPSIVGKDHPGHFRAAYAGITVYQGGIYPADTHGHAFFGNIHDNAIHEEAMDPVGATFNARPVRDFLRANNGWFRPVSIQTGPDGFLWVMDWCDKYPCYQNALANPAGVDREKGRIWRVCYTGSPEGAALAGKSRGEKDMDIAKKSYTERAALVGNPNSWISREAALAHATVDGDDDRLQTPPKLFAKAKDGKTTAERLAALDAISQSLPNFGNLTGKEIMEKLAELASDKEPGIRAKALGIVSDMGTWAFSQKTDRMLLLLDIFTAQAQIFAKAAKDEDPFVRYKLATLLKRERFPFLTSSKNGPPPNGPNGWNKLDTQVWGDLIASSKDATDRTLPLGIWMGLEAELAADPGFLLPWLAHIVPDTKPLSLTLVRKSARRIIDTRSPANVDLLLAFLDKLKDHDDLTAAALEGMLKAQEAGPVKPDKTDPAPAFARWSQSASPEVKNNARRLATLWGDPTAVAEVISEAARMETPLPRRIELLETLRKLRTPATKQAVLDMLNAGGPDNWIIPVLRAAAEVGSGDEFSTPVLKMWPSASPALRAAAAQFLTGRTEWRDRLLTSVVQADAATAIRIPAGEIPATTRRFFATSTDAGLRAQAEKVLGRWSDSNDETKALIAAKRKALTEGEPDMALGKTLFTALCSTCHMFHGGGQEVGPELIGSGRSNLDAILANVIDPNQIIGNGYQNFTITTKDGRTLGGRIVEDTPTQVTLLGLGGSREVVPAADIVKKEDSGLSLMPMGFGSLPDDQLRSLIWYLLAPPEEGPLTPAKKEALIKGAEAENPAAPPKAAAAPKAQRIDWESVSLWNPEWKVTAPEFEGTPQKLTEFEGRKNVLQMHPFPDKKSPAFLTGKLTVPAAGRPALHFEAAAKGGSDWDLVVRVDQKEIRRTAVNTGNGAWVHQVVDLVPWLGKTVEIQLENHPTGWSWEFSYWSDVKLVP